MVDMPRIKQFISNLSKRQKIIFSVGIIYVILMISILIPTLANYKNNDGSLINSVWDGSVASSYHSGTGTNSDPYIITNGAELAYLSAKLTETDYDNTYFLLSNSIILNDGVLKYDSVNGATFTTNNQIFYLEEYTNKYFDNLERDGAHVSTLNIFPSLVGFKGYFNGDNHTIYGLYITDSSAENLALFNDLEGNVSNLHLKNSLVHGGSVTSGLASTASNSLISDVLVDGFVVSRHDNLNKILSGNLNFGSINVQNYATTNYINLKNSLPFAGSEVTSLEITGDYNIINDDGSTTLSINDNLLTGGSFSLDLGQAMLEQLAIVTSTNAAGVSINFTNVTYSITLDYSLAAGIIAESDNNTITNTINRAEILSHFLSAGLVAKVNNDLDIAQSYNEGTLNSLVASGGLVALIENSNNVTITNSYNEGLITAPHLGGLISIINNNSGSTSLNNVFDAALSLHVINSINNASVNVTNALYVSSASPIMTGSLSSGSLIQTNKDALADPLVFNEYIDQSDMANNPQNAWVYEDDQLPKLYHNNALKNIATIHVGTRSFKQFISTLETVYLNNTITFSIENGNDLTPISSVEYYVNESDTPLTKDELLALDAWEAYTTFNQITMNGNYIIYAKITDYKDRVTYLNSAILSLSTTGPSVIVSDTINSWNNLTALPVTIYTNQAKTLTVTANADSGIASIKYYKATNLSLLNESALDALNSSVWTNYTNEIIIDAPATYIVYVQVIDNAGNTTYVSTDYIDYQGYTLDSLIMGLDNHLSYQNLPINITNKSILSLQSSYLATGTTDIIGDISHNLVTSILLPEGTKINLKDDTTNTVYSYQIPNGNDEYGYENSCNVIDSECVKKATYPFSLFKEIGSVIERNFIENSYFDFGTITENFTVILDFAKTNITNNYPNAMAYLELRKSTGEIIRSTLETTKQTFNLYAEVNAQNAKADLYLSSDHNGSPIYFNTESVTTLNLTSGLSYKTLNSLKIIDTRYEQRRGGISIRMTDSANNIINKALFTNINFAVGSTSYQPNDDHIIRIPVDSLFNETNFTLKITTTEGLRKLKAGTYYFKIANYTSFDGIYLDEEDNVEVSIPVIVQASNYGITHKFDVKMNQTNASIAKNTSLVTAGFTITENSNLANPNIRVTLYEKVNLTAFDQDYVAVDLQKYISQTLTSSSSNVYFLTTTGGNQSFNLTFVTSKLAMTGYKLIFELYDNDLKIDSVKQHFIVR